MKIIVLRELNFLFTHYVKIIKPKKRLISLLFNSKIQSPLINIIQIFVSESENEKESSNIYVRLLRKLF